MHVSLRTLLALASLVAMASLALVGPIHSDHVEDEGVSCQFCLVSVSGAPLPGGVQLARDTTGERIFVVATPSFCPSLVCGLWLGRAPPGPPS